VTAHQCWTLCVTVCACVCGCFVVVACACVLSGAALWPVVTPEGPGHNPLAWCATLRLNCSSSHGPHWAPGNDLNWVQTTWFSSYMPFEKQIQQKQRLKIYFFKLLNMEVQLYSSPLIQPLVKVIIMIVQKVKCFFFLQYTIFYTL